VVRAFKKGRGWVFLVRVEDVEDRDSAASVAHRLAELTGSSVQVLLVAGRDVLPVEELAVAAPSDDEGDTGELRGDAAAGPVSDAVAARAEGGRLLAALVLAHGGGLASDDPVLGIEAWDPVHFRFERSVDLGDGAMRVWHDFARAGERIRLEVRVMEGEGRNSVTLVDGDQAWLWVDGELHDVAAGPTREALGLFSPAVVLEQAVSFATWAPDLPARSVERASADEPMAWFELERERSDRVLVGLDPADHRVRALVVEGDSAELSWSFGDYQEVRDGLVVPLRLESRFDGHAREHVTVRTLELPDELDASLFDPELLKKP
jgi:hypothetical protein